MENVYEVPNFLTKEELTLIEEYLTLEQWWQARSEKKEDPALGRLIYTVRLPEKTLDDIKVRVEELLGRAISPPSLLFVDYESRYGQPNLPPHFDGDNNDVIVDYQYKSNTSWGLGVGSEVFEMTDNKAIIFNPNEHPHWRPYKTFQEREYVTMMFIRFPSPEIDYSHMRHSQDHEIFSEARKVRESLKSEGMA